MRRTRARAATTAAGAAGLAAYVLAVRPWILTWGATPAEARQSMPGDDRVTHPWLSATRAITIDASPTEIWPWLTQMGYRRAGWYAYDWIDNDRIPSADRILPEFQAVQVGTLFPTGPGAGFTLVSYERNRAMLLEIDSPDAHITFSLLLSSETAQRTRLVGRIRARFRSGIDTALYFLVFEPGDFIMMRKMFQRHQDTRRTPTRSRPAAGQ